MQLTPKQIEALWINQGGPPDAAPLMAAIAIAESGGRTDALNNNPSTKDYSVGLWQINYYNGLYQARAQRYGPPQALYGNTMAAAQANARAAINLYDQGRGIGNWQGDAAYSAYQAQGAAGLTRFLGYTPSSGGANADGTYGTNHKTQAEIKAILTEVLNGKITAAQADKLIGLPAGTVKAGSSGIGGSIENFLTAVLGIAALGSGGAGSLSPGQIGSVGGAVGGLVGTGAGLAGFPNFKSIADVFNFIFSLRGLQVIGGGIILLMGIYLLARQVGLGGFDAPKVIVQGANTIAGSNQSRATNAALTKAYHEGQADAIGDAQPKKKPARDYGEVPF